MCSVVVAQWLARWVRDLEIMSSSPSGTVSACDLRRKALVVTAP